jgi:hypothetical protein
MEKIWIEYWENNWTDHWEETARKRREEGLGANEIADELIAVSDADQNWKKEWISGWIQGWMEGEESKAFDLAWNMLSMGMSEGLVFDATGLSGETFVARRDAQALTGKIMLLLTDLSESLERCAKAGLTGRLDMNALSGPIEQCYKAYQESKANVKETRKDSELRGLAAGEKSKAAEVTRSLWKTGFNVEMLYVATQLPVESILAMIKE